MTNLRCLILGEDAQSLTDSNLCRIHMNTPDVRITWTMELYFRVPEFDLEYLDTNVPSQATPDNLRYGLHTRFMEIHNTGSLFNSGNRMHIGLDPSLFLKTRPELTQGENTRSLKTLCRRVLLIGPTTPSSRMGPVDKVPVLLAQHQVSDRSEIPLGGVGGIIPASPRGNTSGSLETMVLLQVASPSICLQPFLVTCARKIGKPYIKYSLTTMLTIPPSNTFVL
ncbi:hypothetical protein Tco_0038363 [Tanacetum coccineum]